MVTAIDILTFMLLLTVLVVIVGGFAVWILVKLMEHSLNRHNGVHATTLRPRPDKQTGAMTTEQIAESGFRQH